MENRAGNIRGFTLVEMALVLVVIGIVIGIGAGMIGPLTNLSKTRETKELLGATVESVNSWAASNNSLPNAAGFTSVAKSPNDTWARNVIYLFDNTLYAAAPTKDTICGRKTTALTIINNGVSPAAAITNVAYLVLSLGEDAQINTTATDGPITISRTASGTITLDPNVSDIVRWVTLDELRSKIGCQGAQLKIVNNELPYGNKGSAYPNVSFIPDGGVQFTPTTTGIYEWCWSSTTLQVLSDLTFTCSAPSSSATIARTAAPTTCSLTTGTWQRCTSLNLSSALLNGINPSPGSVDISLALRDYGGNITQKTFVLTINPLSP